MKPLLTIDEASHYLRVGRTSIYKLIRHRQLNSYKIGRRRLVDKESIDLLLKSLSSS
ncbi:hypothetical protein GCM10017044_04910 [Kordiimonas sediminis]|uniref:Helix-turn-helix domain-containing protein n=1 Tax=Kordiimonas sediminis TaxID=1735581 RepID=A0A919AN24_9PROT|nr:hypothetical protein GCM10017044_04910 [Kordiimonas sediminis]